MRYKCTREMYELLTKCPPPAVMIDVRSSLSYHKPSGNWKFVGCCVHDRVQSLNIVLRRSCAKIFRIPQ